MASETTLIADNVKINELAGVGERAVTCLADGSLNNQPLFSGDAADVAVDATGFAGNLGPGDTDVQTALATIDGLVIPVVTRLMGEVLFAINWTNGATYKEYEFSNAAITVNSVIFIGITNASQAVVEAADLKPESTPAAGKVTIYATNVPASDVTVNIVIIN